MVNLDPQTQKFVEMQGEIQALREELYRQRTALMSAKTRNQHDNDESNIEHMLNEEMEQRLQSAQIELDTHKKLVKEAFTRFKHISNNNNNNNNGIKMADEWLNMFETVSNYLLCCDRMAIALWLTRSPHRLCRYRIVPR